MEDDLIYSEMLKRIRFCLSTDLESDDLMNEIEAVVTAINNYPDKKAEIEEVFGMSMTLNNFILMFEELDKETAHLNGLRKK